MQNVNCSRSTNNSLIWWVGPNLAQPKWLGLVRPTPKKKKIFVGPRLAQPNHSWAEFDPISWVAPAHIFIIILYIYIYIFKKTKNPKSFKNYFKNNLIFLNIFLPILHNIGLYSYTVRYKSGIKIPGFFQNIF
jgi:hypothetical protein